MSAKLPSDICLGQEICGDLDAGAAREWLVTNGLGGFACGTVPCLLTRRYHGLLVAALAPPQQRTLLVAKIEEIVRGAGGECALGVDRWADGAIAPQGQRYLDSLRLEGTLPVWTYLCSGARLEKRLWMQHGANTTFVRYQLDSAPGPVELEVKVLVNDRDFHSLTRAGDWRMRIEAVERGVSVTAFHGAVPFYLRSAEATVEIPSAEQDSQGAAHGIWYRDFHLAQEAARGLDHIEDHLHAATFRVTLAPGASATLVFSLEETAALDGAQALAAEKRRQSELLECFVHSQPKIAEAAPAWARQLVLAADSFLVQAASDPPPGNWRVIAGYPWFGVWSRDTLISLSGLTLATGRQDMARSILRSFAALPNEGMLPNFFPESGVEPEFNAADAPLWFIEALRAYFEQTRDLALVRELAPAVCEIIGYYAAGTRYGIQVDPADGLLHCGLPAAAGQPATQVTWMDARVQGDPVTPRVGKPVEINALWLAALDSLAEFARALGQPDAEFRATAARVRRSFGHFWNPRRNCCFDVLDGPDGHDDRLRPNQILAVSLGTSPFSAEQQRAIVDICARELLTPFGLRSLASSEPGYRSRYEGTPAERDAAYHQGTVWPWLLGPFVSAHWKVYRDSAAAGRMIASTADLGRAGLGTVGEICDGNAPFAPRGCFAQAWSVAELMRAWCAVVAQSGTTAQTAAG
jgi:predicted glycogen debranching enzyme